MSSTLVQQALEIVDPDYKKFSKIKKNKNGKSAFHLMPENLKLQKKIKRKGHTEKIGVLATEKKLTLCEARKKLKSPKTILKENLKKIEKIRKASFIELDKEVTEQIIERGITKRPVKPKRKSFKPKKTAFTEEDFKKFEEEYQG